MEIKWLEDFLSLAETRNFSRAASDRNISQSAFSRRIMSLEKWLGVELVDRSVHPAMLTSNGWLFRRLAANLLRDAYVARTLLNSHQPFADGAPVVQFAVAHTLAFNFFPSWLKRVQEGLGALTARVIALNVLEGMQQLVDDDCDLFLGYHHPQLPILLDPNEFLHLSLFVDRIRPYSAPDADGRPLFKLPGSAAHPVPLMAYSSGAFLGNVVEMILLNAPAPCWMRRGFETHMSEALKAMVIAGHGVGWLPESCVADDVARGRLVRAGSSTWTTNLEVRLYRAANRPKPIVDDLWAFLSKHPAPSKATVAD